MTLLLVCLTIGVLLCGCAGRDRPAYRADEIYCCGGAEVFLVNVEQARRDPQTRLWSWRAEDSPRIAPQHRAWFRAMDECKPVRGGSAVLVSSSSSGAVALIRRAGKECLFYAGGRNAHSAELIGDDLPSAQADLLAGAFSYRCNQLRLYRLKGQVLDAKPAWSMRLSGAHGVVWDRKRQVLWALGGSELLKLKVRRGDEPSAEVLKRWKLPAGGGHDLFPLDEKHLAVTVNTTVYQFDAESEAFAPMAGLAGKRAVKSVGRHPTAGQIIYTQGERIFTNKVHWLGGTALVLPPKNMYKARWNAPNPFSYGK